MPLTLATAAQDDARGCKSTVKDLSTLKSRYNKFSFYLLAFILSAIQQVPEIAFLKSQCETSRRHNSSAKALETPLWFYRSFASCLTRPVCILW